MAVMADPRRLGATVLMVLAISACGVKSVKIAGDSMAPTLTNGQLVVVNTSAYDSASPKRGDVVLFKTNQIARIVGLPGETISFPDGVAAVNDIRLNETYLAPNTLTTAPQNTYPVPAGSYFVLHDNRAKLGDSRSFGSVARSAIEGKIG
ncbi:MAG TPA: signal peptidase I [Candidatus Dormibacteraeota bacterium]|nr:signal peptidase I [Candidatus Dormibacteraeota bacterium]